MLPDNITSYLLFSKYSSTLESLRSFISMSRKSNSTFKEFKYDITDAIPTGKNLVSECNLKLGLTNKILFIPISLLLTQFSCTFHARSNISRVI